VRQLTLQRWHRASEAPRLIPPGRTPCVAAEALDITGPVLQRDRENGMEQYRLDGLQQADGFVVTLDAVGQRQLDDQACGSRPCARTPFECLLEWHTDFPMARCHDLQGVGSGHGR
jgi:hypothetical protein